MLVDLSLGQYLPGRSPIHRLDPRTKLAVVAVAVFAIFRPGASWEIAGTWPLLVLGVAASGVPARTLMRGLVPFRWLFGCTVALHALTTPGHPVFGFPAAPWLTWGGLGLGLSTVARLATAVTFATLLTLTTNPLDLVWGLHRLVRPLEKVGIPVAGFGVALLIALRFLPLLVDEAVVLDRAAVARGGGGGFRIRLVRLGRPLAERVVRRADRIARALDARGFAPTALLPSSGTFRFRGADVAALGCALATLAAVWGRTG